MSLNFKLNFNSSDEEDARKKQSDKLTFSDEEDEDDYDYKKKKKVVNIFDDDDDKVKSIKPALSVTPSKSTTAPSVNRDIDIRIHTAPTSLASRNNENKSTSITSTKSDEYSNVIIKSSLLDKPRENPRSSSVSSENSVTVNESGSSFYSKTSISPVPPPPTIGALRYNPAKLLEDSVRRSSISNNHSTNIFPNEKDKSLNEEANNNNSFSGKTNKTKNEEIIELKTRISKLTAELNSTTMKMNDKPDCKTTINRFLLNKACSFDIYKTKREKLQLLNEATNTHDGNVIFAVVNYLKNSLSTSIFYGLLINNPVALNHYVFYLEQMNCHSELAEFYKFQGNSNESASIKYFKPILNSKQKDLSDRIQVIREYETKTSQAEQNLINNGIVIGPVKKQLALLNIQKEILKNKSTFLRKDEVKQNAMDKIYGNSVGYTISFCLKYNRELNENAAYSIENIKKEFDIQTKQFSIWFVKAMSEIGSWTELENFTKQRGIFNMVKSPPVSFETIVYIISKVKGPQEQIKKYINLVENVEKRQALANKFKATDIVIETYKIQKDRIGLMNYRNTFKEGTVDFIKANIVLSDNQIKWKN